MEAMARHAAEALVQVVDFSAYRHLLDVGGGSGAYSIALCRAHPSLQATILDLPGTLRLHPEVCPRGEDARPHRSPSRRPSPGSAETGVRCHLDLSYPSQQWPRGV
ncbi:MAG: methyltransferase [Candidatus Methylomirabilales bacterium]